MRAYTCAALSLVFTVSACDGDPSSAPEPPPSAEPDAELLPSRTPSRAPAPGGPDPSDPANGMTLRLPRPGTPRADVLAMAPGCRAQLEPGGDRCRFHGWIRPLTRPCEGGCTWWTYRFVDDRLDVAELERGEWDVDAEWAGRFTREARRVAEELTRRLGVSPEVDELGRWEAVESSPRGTRVILERRSWALDDVLVTWTVSGRAGHHPGVILRVRVEAAPPDELRVEMLDPELETGAPLLRLRGGPVPRPLDVPLWLTFDARDPRDGDCALHHEAVAFPLPDGRVYVGQYNSSCGGARQCRVIDPGSGAAEEPAGGCLWGEGIHHRAEAIGDGHVLFSSDAEGGGAMEIVRYDPARGSEVELHLSTSATAPLRAEVRDGGVDFSTVCELPPGCEHRDYGEVPSRDYRWTPERGLFAR